MEDDVRDEEGELIHIKPSLSCAKDDHYFIYRSGMEVMCNKCPVGYPVSIGTECRDGHLYIHGEMIL